MSTKDPNPNLGVDPSERNQGGSVQDKEKEKDKGDTPKGKDDPSPSSSSKGINPVQHSE